MKGTNKNTTPLTTKSTTNIKLQTKASALLIHFWFHFYKLALVLSPIILLNTSVKSWAQGPVNNQPTYDASVEFLATGKPGFIKIRGKGATLSGVLASPKEFEVDLNQFTTGILLRDQHMKEKYLETLKFKTSVLSFYSFKPILERVSLATSETPTLSKTINVEIPATLLLHGKSKPVLVKFETLSQNSSQTIFNVKFNFNLSDFGIETPSYLGVTVAERVEIEATVTVKTVPKSLKN